MEVKELCFSEDNGKTYRPLKSLAEVPELRVGGIIEHPLILDDISFSTTFMAKKRHMSRKYKKKHFLLRKQHKRFIKSFAKSLNRTSNACVKVSIGVSKLNSSMLRLNGLLIDKKEK